MNASRTSNQATFIAVAVFLVGVLSGYGLSTQVGAQDVSRIAIPAVPPVEQSQNYFPAQYANQAAAAEDHIEAF